MTGNAVGSTTVKYYLYDSVYKTITINVVDPTAAQTVTINNAPAQLPLGTSAQLSAVLTPAESTDSITWSSSDPAVLYVSDKGVVTARAKGSTEVTVKYGTHTVKVKITVSDDPADAFFGLGDVEDMDYVSLDFSKEIDRTVLSHFNSCEMTATEEGMRVTVKSAKTQPGATDPSFKIVYQGALEPIMTEDYTAVEIVYRVSPENSSHTTALEIFIGAGTVMDAQGGYSTTSNLICDGEYHTLTIPVSHLDYWKGQLNVIRFDFFTAALEGDSMEIKSISLVS